MNYDSFVRVIANETLQSWKKQWLKRSSVESSCILTFEEDYKLDMPPKGKENPLEFDYEAHLTIMPTEEGIYKVDGSVDEGYKSGKHKGPGNMWVEFQIDPQDLPSCWEEIAMDLRDVIRHEIEHLLQGGWSSRASKKTEDDTAERLCINLNLIPKLHYFLLKKEVDAMLYGMYLKAKKRHKPFHEVIKTYLDTQQLSEADLHIILQAWQERSRQLSLPSPVAYEAA